MSKALTAFVLVVALFAVGLPQIIKSSDPLEVPFRYAYDMYKIYYNKQWSNQEEGYRITVFREKAAKFEEFNKNPNNTYKKGINRFSDWTQQEFASIYLTLIPPQDVYPHKFSGSREYLFHEPVIWSKKNRTHPRDQGLCGSSWAYAAVAVVESAFISESFILTDFSEQQILDCVILRNSRSSRC